MQVLLLFDELLLNIPVGFSSGSVAHDDWLYDLLYK